ncbi:hypothetical protein [Stakelama flava]
MAEIERYLRIFGGKGRVAHPVAVQHKLSRAILRDCRESGS